MKITELKKSIDERALARLLFWQGYKISDIAKKLGVDDQKIYHWKRHDRWDEKNVIDKTADISFYRLHQLIIKPNKNNNEFKEIELLMRNLERFARIEHYRKTGNSADLNPKIKNRNSKQAQQKKENGKNFFTDEDVEKLEKAFKKNLFGYQETWEKNRHRRTRNILKSRQIGATWYFSREAIVDALTTGHNKIFLSASKNQALVFRSYIFGFVEEVLDKKLVGGIDSPLIINSESKGKMDFYFLGTNSRTAQSYHGDIMMDEYFWIPNFAEFNKVASGMAMHKKWKKTYISTPSALSHEAYPFWSGEKQKLEIDVSPKALRVGRLDADKIWRHVVTIDDAEKQGCDLFDLEELKVEYSENEFANLLMCKFIDDNDSVFPLSLLQPLCVDKIEWLDFNQFANRPFAGEVWVGYDPSPSIDDASVVVVAPPSKKYAYFRCLEKHSWKGLDYAAQAKQIQLITQKYNVTHLGIDKTGAGVGVFQIVKEFYPRAQAINYSIEIKNRLVMRLRHLIGNKQIFWDASWTDLMTALISIHQTTTKSGNNLTFQAGRTSAGHADLAFALMHALEPMNLAGKSKRKSSVNIY